MKIFKLGKQIKHDYENQRYTFRIYLFGFIPMKMICDWKDNITNKKNGDEGFMHKEYYLFNKLIFKKKHITITCIPNSRI